MTDRSDSRRQPPSERRLVVAFAVAPLVTVPVLAIGVGLLSGDSLFTRDFAVKAGNASLFSLFGLPIAYVVELAIGLPIYLRWLHGRNHPARVIIPVSTVLGAAVMPFAWWEAFRETLDFRFAWVGAAMGLAAGLTFLGLISVGADRRAAI